jgi:hypothetical protein
MRVGHGAGVRIMAGKVLMRSPQRAAKRLLTVGFAMALAGGAAAATTSPVFAASICVGGPGCYGTIQAAVNAAHNGDTVRVNAGTFHGGVTIDVSISLVGAGAASTTVKGGGHVFTIGAFNVPQSLEPTVALSGLTITGGNARTSPVSLDAFGLAGVIALGGGVEIPPASMPLGGGATVTITDSVITGNRAAPTRTRPVGGPCPGNVQCPFAQAGGGGIDNWGLLTLWNTTVSDNLVGSASGLSNLASDADGAGIFSHSSGGKASLTLNDSSVSDNHASSVAPNARFADSGGIEVVGGVLTMNGGSVTDNTASLSSAFPNSVNQLAVAGGIHIEGNASGLIRNSTISGNSLSSTNTVGDAIAFSGGLHADGPVTLRDDTISNNSVSASSTAPSGSAFADSGAGEINAPSTIVETRFTGNSVTATAPHGTAMASAGAITTAGDPITLTDSHLDGNAVSASAASGNPIAQGGALWNISVLNVKRTDFSFNTATASGTGGLVQGGGIWNGPISGGPPVVQLTLNDSEVTHNQLSASSGGTIQGGGLFTAVPVTLIGNDITHNSPDQCFGC